MITDRIEAVFAVQQRTRKVRKAEGGKERIARLQKLRTTIVEHIPAIEQALFEDMRRSPNGGQEGEIPSVLAEIDAAISELADWMMPKPVATSPNFRMARLISSTNPAA